MANTKRLIRKTVALQREPEGQDQQAGHPFIRKAEFDGSNLPPVRLEQTLPHGAASYGLLRDAGDGPVPICFLQRGRAGGHLCRRGSACRKQHRDNKRDARHQNATCRRALKPCRWVGWLNSPS